MGNTTNIKVFIIDDDRDFCLLLTNSLEKKDCCVQCQHETKDVVKNIGVFKPDVILLDVMIPGKSGIEVLKEIKGLYPDTPIIMISVRKDPTLIVAAMSAGATDYIPKDVDNEELIKKIQKLQEMKVVLRTENKMKMCSEIIGDSASASTLLNMIGIVSQSDIPVFMRGESGTGKSFIAELIHKYGKRKDRPFVTINCPGIPAALLESEFFGHEKGSFTGAIKTKEGKFELAEGGTIFLEEVGCLSMDLQAKILRVIQNKEFERVGGVRTIKADVRIIAATNQNIEQDLKEGRFREDLYYRLNVLPIYIPPLRERKEDISAFAERFLELSSKKENKKFNSLSSEVIKFLQSYDWPGNIRELDNAIERAVLMGKEPELKVSDFSIHLDVTKGARYSSKTLTAPTRERPLTSLKEMERADLESALRDCAGNISHAAKALGISRVALYRRMKKHKIGLKS
jgi:DNA-binding NtrC family response regulator